MTADTTVEAAAIVAGEHSVAQATASQASEAPISTATAAPSSSMTVQTLEPSDAMVAIGNEVLASGSSATTSLAQSGTVTPASSVAPSVAGDVDDDGDQDDDFQDAMDDLPATKKLHQRLSQYSPSMRESEEWEQIMQDWDRVMAEKRIQDARLNLVEQENKRMKAQLVEAEVAKLEVTKEHQEAIEKLQNTTKELMNKAKDPVKETKALKNQLEESEAEKELFKLMLEETEAEKKRVEVKLAQVEKEKWAWAQRTDKIQTLKTRLRLKSAQFQLLSTSTSSLLAQGQEGVRPDKERKRILDQVMNLESDRSRLAAMVKDAMNSGADTPSSDPSAKDASTLSNQDLVHENSRLGNELQMSKLEYSLLQSRIEALEVTLHDVRVALTNSEAHTESLEMKKYDLQDKLTATEGSLDRARIESTRYQSLHREVLEKNEKLDREMQVVKARFEAKDRVLMTTQKQLAAAKVDGGLLKTIRRELESVLFDYNTVVQHFMDFQVQAIAAKSMANTLKRKNNELQGQLTHYRSMLLGIKSFNNNDPIKSPTVTTLRSEFRILMEKIQEEQNAQVERERADRCKAQDWNRKLRMEKDFMKLELQNQIEKWRRVSIYWEDKWRKTANDLHEAVTTGAGSDVLFEMAASNSALLPASGAGASAAASPRSSQSLNSSGTQNKRRSLAISTANGNGLYGNHDQPMTPSAMKQHILEGKMRSGSGAAGPGTLSSRPSSMLFMSSSPNLLPSHSAGPVTSISSPPLPASTSPSTASLAVGAITESLTDLVSNVKPFLSRTISQTANGVSATTSSLVGSVGTGRGGGINPSSPSSRLAASASLRTPIAAGLPSSASGVGAMGNTAVSKTSLRSRSMATSAIGTARSQALLQPSSSSGVTVASRDAQTRANASVSTMSRSVDQALSESDRLKADVRRMLNR
ncbi:hypothetical protein BGZ75_005932 [Mortierella antarctica]|nr:hypothetical protein BGZ75_005932 [Mortierella antarctica]